MIDRAWMVTSLVLVLAAPAAAEPRYCGTNVALSDKTHGYTLSRLAVHNLYWGSFWRTNPNGYQQRQRIDAAMRSVLGDARFYEAVQEYDTSGRGMTGFFSGSDQNDTTQLPYIDNASAATPAYYRSDNPTESGGIMTELQHELVNYQVTPPVTSGDYLLYVIYLPPNVHDWNDFIETLHYIRQRFGGYHDAFTGYADAGAQWSGARSTIYYSIIEWSDSLDSLTLTTSHEIWESITDPVNGGYRDQNSSGENEIGDLCNGRPDLLDGVMIQMIYSQRACACVDASNEPVPIRLPFPLHQL